VRGGPSSLEPTFALATDAGREAAVVGLEVGAEAITAEMTTKGTTTAAAAGVLDGPSSFEPASASATDAGREAAVAGLVTKTTDTTTADTAMAAAAGVRGGPSPLEPPSVQPKHDPVRGAGHEPVAGDDEEQQREAQLQDEAQQREAQ
jgi:hypothetical protein